MTKPTTCSGCPLEKKGVGFCKPCGDLLDAKVAVLFDTPEEADVDRHFIWGGAMEGWVLPAVGLHRKDLLLDSVLRCVPPKGKTGRYPVGDERKEVEAHCRVHDIWDLYRPTVGIVTMDLVKLKMDSIPLPLVIADFRKAMDFYRVGERPVLLAGAKAASYWLGQETTPHKWRGHYAFENAVSQKVRGARLV